MSIQAIDLPTLTQNLVSLRVIKEARARRSAQFAGVKRGASKTTRHGRVYRGAARISASPPAKASATDLDLDCPVIQTGRTYAGKQGHAFVAGISAQSVGSTGLCLHLVTIPPGGRGRAHLHAGHETALYVLAGTAETRFGPGLRRRVTVRAGEFHYIPAGVPHLPLNASADEACVAVLARTDPNEQESVVLLPDLEEIALAAD